VYGGGAGCRGDSRPCSRVGTLRRSADGGATFDHIADFEELVRAMSMSPDGSRFWLATLDGSFYRSMDRGETWEPVENTPYRGHLVSLSASPHDPGLVFAVTREGALWAYRERVDAAAISLGG